MRKDDFPGREHNPCHGRSNGSHLGSITFPGQLSTEIPTHPYFLTTPLWPVTALSHYEPPQLILQGTFPKLANESLSSLTRNVKVVFDAQSYFQELEKLE